MRHRLATTALVLGCLVIAPLATAGAKNTATKVVAGDTVVKVTKVTPLSFVANGPYAVGEQTLSLPVAGEGYTTPLEVWYPAAAKGKLATYNLSTWLPGLLQYFVNQNPAVVAKATTSSGGVRNARPAAGRFPLVLFSHGYAGFRDQSTQLTAHLASWGFVVAAPDHPSRDLTAVLNAYLGAKPVTTDANADVADLLATLGWFTHGVSGSLATHVDPTKVVVIGHSAGGSAAERLASYETANSKSPAADPLKGFVALAGASLGALVTTPTAPYGTVPAQPSVFMTGVNDQIVPSSALDHAYDAAGGPKVEVTLGNSGHLVFSDLCQIAPGEGGLLALANGLKLTIPAPLQKLATDGCQAPNAPVTVAWPVIDEVSVAAVRWMLGFDPTMAGLNVASAFPAGVVTTERSSSSTHS